MILNSEQQTNVVVSIGGGQGGFEEIESVRSLFINRGGGTPNDPVALAPVRG